MVTIKEVKVTKIDGENIEIDGVRITIDEYNRTLNNKDDKDEIEYDKLVNEIEGSITDEDGEYLPDHVQIEESKKVRYTDYALWKECKRRLESDRKNLKGTTTIFKANQPYTGAPGDDEAKIQDIVRKNNAALQHNLDLHRATLPFLRSLISKKVEIGQGLGTPLVNPDADLNREEKGKRHKQLNSCRDEAYQAIDQALNEEPTIAKGDYDSELEDIRTAIDEGAVNRVKEWVLADIKKKRDAIKSNDKGNPDHKRKREEDNIPDNAKKPRLDANETKSVAELRNKTIEEIDNNSLATAIKVATQLEGEKEYQKDTEKVKLAEEELIKKDPRLYMQTIVDAIKGRLEDAGIKVDVRYDLNNGDENVVSGEGIDEEIKKNYKILLDCQEGKGKYIGYNFDGMEERLQDFQASKVKLIKKIGEQAKKKVTEKVKKDIKTLQEQFKSFKSGANAYLDSFYQKDKEKIDKLENDLVNSLSTNQTDSPKKTP
ncbi:13645_t:CDS:2, partial [Ambispora leptoticha]